MIPEKSENNGEKLEDVELPQEPETVPATVIAETNSATATTSRPDNIPNKGFSVNTAPGISYQQPQQQNGIPIATRIPPSAPYLPQQQPVQAIYTQQNGTPLGAYPLPHQTVQHPGAYTYVNEPPYGIPRYIPNPSYSPDYRNLKRLVIFNLVVTVIGFGVVWVNWYGALELHLISTILIIIAACKFFINILPEKNGFRSLHDLHVFHGLYITACVVTWIELLCSLIFTIVIGMCYTGDDYYNWDDDDTSWPDYQPDYQPDDDLYPEYIRDLAIINCVFCFINGLVLIKICLQAKSIVKAQQPDHRCCCC